MASIQKILIIDDSTAIRKIIRGMLPGDKVEILEAKNGKEALTLILEQHPNLVVLDFILPGTSGWDVFQAISKNHELWDISLVMMSGKKEEVIEKIPEPFEYFAFVEKPFNQIEMMNGIKNSMQKAEKRKAEILKKSPTSKDDNTAQLRLKIEVMEKEINHLKSQIVGMGADMEKLKAQFTQLVTFMKQKLK